MGGRVSIRAYLLRLTLRSTCGLLAGGMLTTMAGSRSPLQIFLLVATFQTALLTEPMLVFGSGKYGPRLSRYLGVVSIGHWLGMSLFSILFAGIRMVLRNMQNEALGNITLTLTCIGPLNLSLWTMRRACYARMKAQL